MRIDIQDNEWARMKWDISSVPFTEHVCTRFPDLLDIFSEFQDGFGIENISPDQIFRYIIYVYHKKSPLVIKEDDVYARKVYAFKKAGIDINSEQAVNIADHKEEKVVAAIMQFLKFEKDMNYMAWIIQTEVYYNWNQALLQDTGKSSDIKARGDIFKNIKELEENIEELSQKVTRGDTALTNFVAAHKVLDQRTNKITPEDYAK